MKWTRLMRTIARTWPILAILLCWQPGSAFAQDAGTPVNNCIAPEAITPTHLYGLWQLTLGDPESAESEGQLVFERHPEFPGSVRGSLTRRLAGKSHQALVAGDVTDQGFQLEESTDGVNIDAVWSGEVDPAGCGREIRGWRSVVEGRTTQEPLTEQPFALRKAFGWR